MAKVVPANKVPLPVDADPSKVAGCYFRQLGNNYLLTNDWGHHARLSIKDFQKFLAGGLKQGGLCGDNSKKKGLFVII